MTDTSTDEQTETPAAPAAEPDVTVNPADLTETAPVEEPTSEDDSEDDGDDDPDDDGDSDAAEGGSGGRESTDPLDLEGEIAADYLEELLDIADLDGDIDTYVESGRAHVSIVTEADVLVGKDGKVLEALQELARLAVVTETGHRSRLMLDVAGHRDQRRTELLALAGDAINEARTGNESVRLSPMNAFERKIVHDAVAAAGLTSESEGEEPQRRVVVIP